MRQFVQEEKDELNHGMNNMLRKNKNTVWNSLRVLLATLNKKWVLKSFLFSIPVLAALLLSTPLKTILINDDKFTKLGVVVIIASVIIVPLQFLTSFVASNDNADVESYVGEIQVRKKVAETQCEFEESKNRLLAKSFKSIAYNNGALFDFARHHINPSERTSQILSQISICFADVCDISSNEIVVSAMVSCDNNDWDWLCPPQYEGCADKDMLLSSASSLKKVIDEGVYYYNNNKQDAINEGEYVPDKRDKKEDNMGSIICWEVASNIKSLKKTEREEHTFRMIISISTYGRMLCIDDNKMGDVDRTYKEIFKNIILNQFQGELCENLLWYGFQYLN